jgi:hypothetical protein
MSVTGIVCVAETSGQEANTALHPTFAGSDPCISLQDGTAALLDVTLISAIAGTDDTGSGVRVIKRKYLVWYNASQTAGVAETASTQEIVDKNVTAWTTSIALQASPPGGFNVLVTISGEGIIGKDATHVARIDVLCSQTSLSSSS